jgi:hypothetical protein
MSVERKKVNSNLIMVLSFAFFVTGIALASEQTAIKKYPIPNHGVLELNVLASWKIKVHKPQEDLPPTIILSPAKGNDFEALITVLWDTAGEPDFNSPEKVRTLVEKDSEKILPKAVESKIVLKEIRGPENTGYFYSLTDKAPQPGEFRYMTRGGMAVGNLFLSVTILYRAKESESVKEALFMLREAKQISK